MGGLADAFVEAYDAANLSLGVRAVTGVSTIDVSALFGGVPLRSFRLTAAGDSQQIGRLGFRPAPSSGTLLQLRGFAAVQTPQFEICDVTITGSAEVVLSSTGLGIAGASSPTLLDGFEWVRFDFDRPQPTVFYETEAVADLNANGTDADAFVEGYGANGGSLGLVSVSGDGQHVVTDLFAGAPLSGFRVVANSDAQRLLVVAHVPEPGALALGSAAGVALAALSAARRRLRRDSAG